MRIAAILVAATLLASPVLAQDAPKLTGTWKAAASDGMSQDGPVGGPVTLVVGEQTGRSFKAEIIYAGESGEMREPLLGTVTPDGKTVLLVGDDGFHMATLQSATVLDTCYVEADDDDGMVVCSRLEKQ